MIPFHRVPARFFSKMILAVCLLGVPSLAFAKELRIDIPQSTAAKTISPYAATPSLVVTVRDALTAQAISEATVSAGTIAVQTTNRLGICSFTILPATLYVIDVTKAGYYLIHKATAVVSATSSTEIVIYIPPVVSIQTITLPLAETGLFYNEKIDAIGGEKPYLFRIVSGVLPSGLSLDASAGIISGTPTSASAYTFILDVTDTFSSSQKTFTIEQYDPLVITTGGVLPNGTRGVPYAHPLHYAGGKPPYSFSVVGGEFPNGLALSATGIVSGTPTVRKGFFFALEITDGRSKKFRKEFALEIFNPLAITVSHFLNGLAGKLYSQELTTSGGYEYESCTWSVYAGRLPQGMQITQSNPQTWILAGVPADVTSASFTLSARDVEGRLAFRDYTLFVSDMDLSLSQTFVLDGHSGPVSFVGFSRDGKIALTSGYLDGYLKLWNVETGKLIYTIQQTYRIQGAEISPNGIYLLTGDGNGLLSQWLAATGMFERTFFDGHTDQISSLDLSNDGDWILTGSYDRTAVLWNYRILNNQRHWFVNKTYTGHTDKISSARFSPDETKILTGSWDQTARLWDKTTANTLITFSGHTGPVLSAGFSPSGTRIVTGSGDPDNTARLWTWNGTQATLLKTLVGHKGAINSAAYSPDGYGVLTASMDSTVKIWDASDYSTILSFDWSDSPAYTSAFSPNGNYLLTGYDGQAVLRWLGPSIKVLVNNAVTGAPIANATVTLSAGLTRWTDAQGVCHFRYLPSGNYEVRAEKSGFQQITPPAVTIAAQQTSIANIELTYGSSQPLNIYLDSMPMAETGEYYFKRVSTGGGQIPYTFKISYGSLPLGLSLDSSVGIVSGTPSVAGSYSFGLGVTDSNSTYVEKEFVIHQVNPLQIVTSERLPNGTKGIAYSCPIRSAGGLPPLTPSVLSGSLPAGITINASGILTGSPTSLGDFSFTIRIKDSRNKTSDKNFLLTILEPLSIAMTRMNDGIAGMSFSQPLTFTGGNQSGPVTWNVAAGDSLSGLQLIQQASQTWVLSGTPAIEAKEILFFTIGDQDGRTASKGYSFTVAKPLAIDTITLPDGKKNEAYGESIRVSGGIPPYKYTFSGLLPTGLTLNQTTGLFSGTATTAQLSNFTAIAADSAYPASTTVTKPLSIRITTNMTIITPSLIGNSVKGVKKDPIPMLAKGGRLPQRWSMIAGALPADITVDSASGTLKGVPGSSGIFQFTLLVVDADGVTAQKEFTWPVFDPPRIETQTLPDAALSSSYYYSVLAKGGILPYKWRVASGSLPTGLLLTADTGILYGVPTKKETVTFTLEAADSFNPAQTAKKTYTVTVDDNIFPTVSSLPDGLAGSVYSATFFTKIGAPPYFWRIESGSLPEGVTLQESTRSDTLIAGTPIQEGTYTFRLGYSDSSALPLSQSRPYQLRINSSTPPATPTPTVTPTSVVTNTPTATKTTTPGKTPSATPTRMPSSTPTRKPTATSTPTVRPTATQIPTKTPTLKPNVTPSPTPKPGSTNTPTKTPTKTPTPKPIVTPSPVPTLDILADTVNVYDDETSVTALVETTDFDDLTNRKLVIRWNYSSQETIDDWHIYVRRGDGGYFYVGRTGDGLARHFIWIDPDVNAQYQFRVWGLSANGLVVLSQPSPIGYNLTGGTDIKLKKLANPDDISVGKAIVTDDLLSGTDLSSWHDTDTYLERALALKWNPGSEPCGNFHIYISVNGRDYTYLGQTGAGDMYYFRFDGNGTFSLDPNWKDGPQDNAIYWFRVLALQNDGGILPMNAGPVQFLLQVNTASPTPQPPPIPTPIPGEPVTIPIASLPAGASPLQMQPIQRGTFVMGSPSGEKDGNENERPQHQVSIGADFYMGKYEVTNAQFAAFLNAKGNKSPENFYYLDTETPSGRISFDGTTWIASAGFENDPAPNISWYGARDFCAWTSELYPWIQIRLPTEAEWEYACRAGTTTRFYWGEDNDVANIANYAWYTGNSNAATHAIGQKLPNAWLLYDMSGNIWEWCQDLFGAYSSEPQTDPAGADSGEIRVQRGGDYASDPGRVRSAKRRWDLPEMFSGFRVAATRKN